MLTPHKQLWKFQTPLSWKKNKFVWLEKFQSEDLRSSREWVHHVILVLLVKENKKSLNNLVIQKLCLYHP